MRPMESIKFISLFAGVGGFDLAFEREGMECVAQVEIDPSCRAVLSEHFPDVPRFDDIRTVGAHNLPDNIDVVCGGFPCQGLSVAGRRKGLADDRSGLFWEMLRVIYETRPKIVVWENVPGLLSTCSCSKCGRCCTECGAVAGGDDESCSVCGGTKFSGRVLQNHRGADFYAIISAFDRVGFDGAWRILDAQYFGVPQRRRRLFGVFVSRDFGNSRGLVGAPSWEELIGLGELYSDLLLESDGVRRDTAKGRGKGQGDKRDATEGIGVGGDVAGTWTVGSVHIDENSACGNQFVADTLTSNYASNGGRSGGNDTAPVRNVVIAEGVSVVGSLTRNLDKYSSSGEMDADHLIPIAFDGRNLDTHEVSPTLQAKAEGGHSLNYTPMVADRQLAAPLVARQAKGAFTDPVNDNIISFEARVARNGSGKPSKIVSALRAEAHGYSGTGDSMPLVAFSSKDHGADATEDIAPTLRAQNFDKSHINGGGQVAIAETYYSREYRQDSIYPVDRPANALTVSNTRIQQSYTVGHVVRRLTPTECARLQGFPDDWNKSQSNSVRYRQFGNAVAEPVVRWISRKLVSFLRKGDSC